MTFSQKKISVLGNRKGKGLFTFFIAFVCAAAIIMPYIFTGNGILSLFGDFNCKLVPFYKYCHEAIRSGRFYWSFESGLGADFIGYYSFYLLGNPFFLITLAFPGSAVPYLIGPVVMLEFACAALAAYLYIRRFLRTPTAAATGGLLYAFSGFSVCGLFYGYCFEAVILFPLLLLALELFVTENRRGIYAVTVALCALNCRFFAGIVLFSAVYFFVRALSGAIRITVWRFVNLIFEFIVGALMAAALFIPFALAAAENIKTATIPLGSGAVAYSGETYLDIIRGFFFPPENLTFLSNETPALQSGWLPLFGMAGVIAFFKSRGKSWLKVMATVCGFIIFIPILNGTFSGLGTGCFAGWLYMPTLLLCLMTAVVLEDTSVRLSGGLIRSAVITAAFALVIGLFPQAVDGEIVLGLFGDVQSKSAVLKFTFNCIIALCCVLTAALLIWIRGKSLKAFLRCSVAAVCVISVLYSHVYIANMREDTPTAAYKNAFESRVTLPRDDNYRVDVFGAENAALYQGLSSIAAADGPSAASVKKFYSFTGVGDTLPDTGYAALRSLLSVKYLLNDKTLDYFRDENGNEKLPGYSYLKTEGGYHVYENGNFAGYGFSYDYYMTYDYCERFSGSMRTELMLKAMLLSNEQVKKYRYTMSNITTADFDYIYSNDLSGDAAALNETAAIKFSTDERGFSATVKRDSRSLVFFSVPYAEGWSATVNGKAAEIEEVNAGFMAVAVDKGTSVIRFDYYTPGLDTGIYVSLAALIVFLIYFIAVSIYTFSHKPQLNYPEGEQLLARWIETEAAAAKEDEDSLFEPSLLDKLEDIPDKPGDFGGFNVDKNVFDE